MNFINCCTLASLLLFPILMSHVCVKPPVWLNLIHNDRSQRCATCLEIYIELLKGTHLLLLSMYRSYSIDILQHNANLQTKQQRHKSLVQRTLANCNNDNKVTVSCTLVISVTSSNILKLLSSPVVCWRAICIDQVATCKTSSTLLFLIFE